MWIEKVLTRNDLGQNASHQSGITIPLSHLPALPAMTRAEKNPRHHLNLIDGKGGSWPVSLIYYNNKFHGGTRNEIRLTGTIHCFREHGCGPGDVIRLQFSSEEVLIVFDEKRSSETSYNVDSKLISQLPPTTERVHDTPGWTRHTIRRGKR